MAKGHPMDDRRTFVLTVWPVARQPFRATLRAVDEESACAFDSAQALAEHLIALSVPASGSPRTTVFPTDNQEIQRCPVQP